MKKLYTISNLFEQADFSKTKISLTGSKSSPTEQILVQWTYKYSWPESNQLLGGTDNFAKALNSSTDKTVKTLLDTVKSSNSASVVGIFREAGNTQNKRTFAKDLAETTGSIFLFKPEAIDTTLVPTAKQLEKLQARFTFELNSVDASAYYKKEDSSTGQTDAIASPASVKDSGYFLDRDGRGSMWYTTAVHGVYIKPIVEVINDDTQGINQTGKISPIFWSFMLSLPPADFSLTAPSNPSKFDQELGKMIGKLMTMAGNYDKNYLGVDTGTLSSGLFKLMVESWIIVCLNAKIIVQSNIENDIVPAAAKKPLDASLKEAGLTQSSTVPTSTTSSKPLDGTAINSESDLLKIASGIIATYPNDFPNPNAYDLTTEAGVRTLAQSIFGSSVYQNILDAMNKYKGFEYGKSYNSQGFRDVCNILFGINPASKFDDKVKAEIVKVLPNITIK